MGLSGHLHKLLAPAGCQEVAVASLSLSCLMYIQILQPGRRDRAELGTLVQVILAAKGSNGRSKPQGNIDLRWRRRNRTPGAKNMGLLGHAGVHIPLLWQAC